MAVTITQQPDANTFHSSEYPLVIKATSNASNLRYIRFRLLNHSGATLGLPDYFAPSINGVYSFNVSDYMNTHLYIERDDLVSFDSTPTIHVYNNLLQDVEVQMTEILTTGAVSGSATSNEFNMAKFKHQVYNEDGTAEEYISTRKALSSMPYHIDAFNNLVYAPDDGRLPFSVLTDYSRVSWYLKANQSIFAMALVGLDRQSVRYAEINISHSDLTSNGATVGAINSIPANLSDLQALSSTGWQIPLGGGAASVSDVNANFRTLIVMVIDTSNPPSAVGVFIKSTEYKIPCPKTFIYMNRFGVHESITFSSKENQSIVSTRDTTTMVNTDPYAAYNNDLGSYFLTGARQKSINARSEREYTINNTIPIPHEQAQEIALDFFASPVHYVVDEGEFFAPSSTISHPDTGTQKIKRITINGGTTAAVIKNRGAKFQFTYRYADIL